MVLAIKISQNSREKLGLVICIACAILAACGLMIIGLAIYMQIHINDQLILLESYNSGILPHFLTSVGTLMILLNGVCTKIAYDAGFANTSERFRIALVPLLIILALFCIVIMSAGIVCLTHRSSVEEALHNGLKDAMKRYKNNLKVKVTLDKLQMKIRCCGSRSYQDWFNIGWVNTDYVNKKSPQVKAKMNDGDLYIDSVPFSCCSVTSRRPCIAHNIAAKSRNNEFDEKTLNQDGCTDKLMDELENKLLYPAGCFVLTLFGFQILVTTLLRYLQTSVQHAFEEGDPEGLGTGFCVPNVCPGDPSMYVRTEALHSSRWEEFPSTDEMEESFMGQPASGYIEESFLGQGQEAMGLMDQVSGHQVSGLEGGGHGGGGEEQGMGGHTETNRSNRTDTSSSRSRKDKSASESRKDKSSSKSKKDKSSSKSRKDKSASESRKDKSKSESKKDKSSSKSRKDQPSSKTRNNESSAKSREDKSSSQLKKDKSSSKSRKDKSESKSRKDKSSSKLRRDKPSSKSRKDKPSESKKGRRSSKSKSPKMKEPTKLKRPKALKSPRFGKMKKPGIMKRMKSPRLGRMKKLGIMKRLKSPRLGKMKKSGIMKRMKSPRLSRMKKRGKMKRMRSPKRPGRGRKMGRRR